MSTPLVQYTSEAVLERHRGGKLEMMSRIPCATPYDLTLAYTPGVASVCKAIAADPAAAGSYTGIDNMVAVVTNGTAVLGLGDIGPLAGHPVMEGKCLLFKMLAGVDAFPLSVTEPDPDRLVELIKQVAVSFGGINLEDVKAPDCFRVVERLEAELAIPFFHDDQNGTAVVVLAALLNAVEVVGKKLSGLKVVINGAGAAGTAVARLLASSGVEHIILCDRKGAIYPGRGENMNRYKEAIAVLNRDGSRGPLAEVLRGADVFIGLSVGGQLQASALRRMAPQAIVFAMANPVPEVMPEDAEQAGIRVIATGRSDYPNQINNVLGFPGIFRGVLSVKAKRVTGNMILAAARALAGLVPPAELTEKNIVVSPLHPEVMAVEAAAVAAAAVEDGVAAAPERAATVYQECKELVSDAQKKFRLLHPEQ